MATASLLPMARAVFYNFATGDALSSGYVYTYVPGSTTPKTTWKDAGETTPNSNPIILDAAGSCLLYGSGSYQLTVTDSLGNQIPGYSGVTTDVAASAGISAAMQPVVNAATTTIATGLLTVQAAGSGAITRSVSSKLGDVVTVGDFGAIGNTTADDTAAIQTAINAVATTGATLLLEGTQGSHFSITAPLLISSAGMHIVGSNPYLTKLIARGNFGSILSFSATAAGIFIDNVGFTQDGTTTPCVSFTVGSQVVKFTTCEFSGNLAGNLIYSQCSGYLEFWGCAWDCNSANTQGIVLDGFNQDTVFMGGRAGGPGQWLIIENTSGNIANNVQGTKSTAFTSICTGPSAVQISGNAYSTQFFGCIIDQAQVNCIVIGGGASLTQIVGGYWAVSGSSGVPILITAQAGPGNTINAAEVFGGSNSIQVQASGGSQVGGVTITGNTFLAATTTTVSLDSVDGCIITGNLDLSTPTNGSYSTSATFGAGAYTEGPNSWYTTAPAAFHTGSSYHALPSRGITLANKGVATSASGTTLVVNHGLVTTPNVITITQIGGSGMNAEVSATSGTTFTITYGTSGAATFMWTAEYYT